MDKHKHKIEEQEKRKKKVEIKSSKVKNEEETKNGEMEEEEEKVTVTTTPATTQPTTISQPQEVYAPVEEENFYTKYKYVLFVGLAYLLVIAVIIMVAVKLFRKK